MAYGIKYTFTFESLHTAKTVVCNILQKDYAGSATTITGYGRSPIVLEYESTNDLLQPIVGGKIALELIGNSSFNLSTFETVDDTEWRCDVTVDGNLYFTGFLLPEETVVPLLFGSFPFKLTFTDQLALLRNKKYSETVPGAAKTDDVTLARIVAYILRLTGLELNLGFYMNAWPLNVSTSIGTWADDVYLLRYFSEDEEKQPVDCLTLLEQIMISLNAMLVQSRGQWNVVSIPNWANFQTNGVNGIDGGILSYDFTTNTVDVLDTVVSNLVPVNRSQQLTRLRPVQTITNKYDYRKPIQIENIELNQLGSLISSSTVGTITTKTYALSGWSNQNNNEAVIKVEIDDVAKVERARWIESPFKGSDSIGTAPDALVSNIFYVENGDRADFTFSYAATTDSSSNDRFRMAFFLDDLGSGSKRSLTVLGASNPQLIKLNWNAVAGSTSLTNIPGPLAFNRLGSAAATDYTASGPKTLDVNDLGIPRFPFDSEARVALHCFNNNSSAEPNLTAKINSIKFDYQFFINDTNETIGQKHVLNNAAGAVKNTVERDVFVDDSPRFLAKGTMYRIVSGAKVKTTTWSELRSSTSGDFTQRFGELLIRNELILRGVERDRISGEFVGMMHYTDIVNFSFDTDRYYLPGRLFIDLKSEQVTGDFTEVERTVTDAAGTYEFNYIFNTKP